MKRKLFTLLLLFIVLFAEGCTYLIPSATHTEGQTTQQIFALDTVITITAYGAHAQEGIIAAKEEITRLEKLFSTTLPDSDIAKINHTPRQSNFISSDTAAVLKTSLEVAHKSGGALDISIYPIVELWGFISGEYRVPDQNEIEKTLAFVDYQKIDFDEDNQSVTLAENMQLDLGAVAKGYISQKAAAVMKKAGVESAVINLGGNVQTLGENPDESGNWKIGIQYLDTGDYFCTLQIGEGTLATSGAYQRNFAYDGTLYHHIIDPKTGYPAEGKAASVTVLSNDGTLADALSTVFFIIDIEKASEYYRENDGFEFVILTKDNRVYVTEGIRGAITLSRDYADLSIQTVKKT
ncbi:MAG: FAD:protein FMN transferase [Acutalibacteraceae bacterium]|nr:FAD:protein FMN transferase [Acutalibacteraceae bacterium]HIR03052.1 FAD:protein FMN transferase [Candidatus Scatovicinus merdipullorum]